MKIADLHLHTTASDGCLSPSAMVNLARKHGFSAIAITDHDTTAGLDEASVEGSKCGLEVIPGLELSTLNGEREIHLLGYFPDCGNLALQSVLAKIIAARQSRAFRMIKKLNQLGVAVSLLRIKEIAGSEFIGRPHIARAMIEEGYIKQVEEAFTENYIGRGGKAYVERFKLDPFEGIELLLQAGAIPVLAHPGFLSRGAPVTETEIKTLKEAGLRGIEVYYSRHSSEQERCYKAICLKNQLLITGGSDCHGAVGAVNCLGSVKLPYSFVELLKSEWKTN